MVNERPIVSFTFDDFPKSAVASAAALLGRQRRRRNILPQPEFNGATVEGIEYYDLADVKRLIDNGHEIGCHTAWSPAYPAMFPARRWTADLEENAQFVREHFGDVRMTSVRLSFRRNRSRRPSFRCRDRFAACRTTSAGANCVRRRSRRASRRAPLFRPHQPAAPFVRRSNDGRSREPGSSSSPTTSRTSRARSDARRRCSKVRAEERARRRLSGFAGAQRARRDPFSPKGSAARAGRPPPRSRRGTRSSPPLPGW